jgi:hypothetical protein
MTLRYIKRLFINFFRAFFRFLERIIRPAIGTVVFAILAIMEVSDWTSLMSRYSNPGKDAITLGITTQQSSNHLLIMIALATGIVLGCLVTIVGLFQDERWIIRTAQFTGIVFILYGAYQVYSGIALISLGKETTILAGVVYMIIGAAVSGLGSKFAHPAQLPQKSSKA